MRLLDESLEADIISRDEYEQQKQRIERQLSEDAPPEELAGVPDEPSKPKKEKKRPRKSAKKQPKEEPEKEAVEEKEEAVPEAPAEEPEETLAEEKESAGSEVGLVDEGGEMNPLEVYEEKNEAKKLSSEAEEADMPEAGEEPEDKGEETGEEEPEEEIREDDLRELHGKSRKNIGKSKGKGWKALLAIIGIVLLILIFYQWMFKGDAVAPSFACMADTDCAKTGFIGTCISPNTSGAECQFETVVPVNLTLIGDPSCTVCDSARMESVLAQLFPGIQIQRFSIDSEEGRQIVQKNGIGALPAYLLGKEAGQAPRFGEFQRALIQTEEGDYLVSPSASGASYFFRREPEEGRLDLYLTEVHPVEKNVEEVLQLLGSSMRYESRIVSEEDKEKLKNEMAITSYPTFVVNNQFKFSGLQSAESIKEKFCAFNPLDECATVLSVS